MSDEPCPWCADLTVEITLIDGTKRTLPACADDCNCEEDCGEYCCEMSDYAED